MRQPAQPPVPPVPPPSPAVPGGAAVTATLDGVPLPGQIEGAAPDAIYRALIAQRRELRSQLERVQEQRQDVSNRLRDDRLANPDREGLTARLRELDGRISSIEQQLGQADLAVSKAAAVPGAIVEAPRPSGPPEEVIIIPIVFTVFVLAPLAIVYARRIWKRGATVIAPVPRDVVERLDQMGEAVESIALEVERIGEGQRFLTRVMGDARSLSAGAAQPIPVPAPDKVTPEYRP
jgi:hypothetical protein